VTSDPLRVLIVDDAPDHAKAVETLVRSSAGGREAVVETASSRQAAVKASGRTEFDVALVSERIGELDVSNAGVIEYFGAGQPSADTIGATMRHALALRAEAARRRDAESALRATEERFRALLDNSSDALMLIDRDGRISYITPSSQRLLAREPAEMAGRSIFDFLHPDDREIASVRLAESVRRPGEAIAAELRLQHADGSWHSMEAIGVNRLEDAAVRAIVVTARDVTERRRLEDQLRQAQKMEAIGRLAGGIAHDFNNLLTAILGYCNLMLDDMPAGDPLRSDLQEIREAGNRAASLTRQLLAFSRRQMLQPQIVDMNALVAQMEKLLRRLIGEDVELVTALASNLESVKVDPASIEQVLVNLAVNARDAMPVGGRLTVETSMVELDNAYAETHVTVVPGRYVMLAVSDTGQGMDAPTRARVFEPFFTTKEQGRGVGLGLATVYGIVKQNGGYIWVYSEVGHGTVFKVYLPPANAEVAQKTTPTPADAQKNRGWETVLLVEDEDAVRALAREVLRRHGYVVLEARHGLDALRIAERHQDAIHLMITDVVMPHMSGRDLATRLTGARPNMKVLFISGYTDHAVMHRELTPGAAFLQKPFTPENFARTVRGVLGP
jgi:two-component system, cell cycle sensor histidine kinase and response regulator CckA